MQVRRERVAAEVVDAAQLPNGRTSVKRLLAAHHAAPGEYRVLLVAGDLDVDGRAVFGYANRKRRVAVVSACRLGSEPGDRVENVIAHELGHLTGRRHCPNPGCLMHPARTPAELDARALTPCGRCPKYPWLVPLGIAAAVLVLFLTADAAVRLALGRRMPFSARGPAVLYRAEPVLELHEAVAARRSAEALNALFQSITPATIEVAASGNGAELRAGGILLAEVDRGADAAGWASRMNELMRAKGTRAEGCPDCHLRRTGEVLESARRRARAWR